MAPMLASARAIGGQLFSGSAHQTTAAAQETAEGYSGTVSEENVELVRSALPRSGTDLIAMFNDDSDGGALMQMGRALGPDFVAVKHFPGAGGGCGTRTSRPARRLA
jgi:hypothetical protein